MSLGIAIKGPEGIVLASDSRATLTAFAPDKTSILVNFDNSTKILNFKDHPNVGVVTYGVAGIGLRTPKSLLPEFEDKLRKEGQVGPLVKDFAKSLSTFFLKQWQAAPPPSLPSSLPPQVIPVQNITFLVGGYNKNEPYGEIYLIEIPNAPEPIQQNPPPNFGITWGGQREIVDRLVRGYDERVIRIIEQTLALPPTQVQKITADLAPLSMQSPIQFLPLQDCIDLAIFFIRTTIEAQRLTVGIRGVGGNIDVAIITRDGFHFIQEKKLRGEYTQGS